MGHDLQKMESYGANLSPTFNKNQDLVPWIGEQQYFEMLVRHFSIDFDIYNYVGKLPKQHFNVWLFSNPGEKILILVEILWSQDVRVEHKHFYDILNKKS